MSQKLRYGPRFKPTIADPPSYDEVGDAQDRKHRMKTAAMAYAAQNAPLHVKELRAHKNRQRSLERYEPHRMLRKEREEAEERMAETVRQAVSVLEFGLTALAQVPKVASNYKAAVNLLALTNAIVDLRTKCGVHFDTPSEFHRVSVNDACSLKNAPEKTPEQEQTDRDFREMTNAVQKRERERLERIKLMKAAKAKLAAKR